MKNKCQNSQNIKLDKKGNANQLPLMDIVTTKNLNYRMTINFIFVKKDTLKETTTKLFYHQMN